LKSLFWQGTENWERLLEARADMSGSLVTYEFTGNAIAAFDLGARS
jgi:methylglutaconyl-CoA hydratase